CADRCRHSTALAKEAVHESNSHTDRSWRDGFPARSPDSRRAKRSARGKCGKRQEDFFRIWLLSMPRLCRSGRCSRRATESGTANLGEFHEICSASCRTDAAVYSQGGDRSGTRRHLCISAVDSEATGCEEYSHLE